MRRDQRIVLVIAILASFVSFLDGTVVNVALPAIMRELGGGISIQQWVVDAYLVTLGALILVAGSLSDVFGRIRIVRIGLIGFGIASLAIAAAPTSELLIVARAAQGVAGALLVPSSLALITANFAGEARGRAIGIWTGMTSVAMLIGPFVGGLFVDLLSWRWAFLINVVPIGVALVLLGVLGQRDERRPGVRIDVLGAVLCTIGLGGPVFALIEQPNLGWTHPAILSSLIVGVLSFAGFLIRQRLPRTPMMPLDLYRVRNFWTGNVATAFIYAAFSLNGFVLGIFLQEGAGLSATLAGVAMLPGTVLLILFSSRVGALAGRFGARIFMTLGPIVAGIGTLMLLMVQPDFDYWWQVLPSVLVFGLGVTITVSPLTSAILGAIESERSGIASAVNNAVSRVAGLLAIASLAFIVGGELDLEGLHRSAIVTAVLLVLGGVVSWLGIRDRAGVTHGEESPAVAARSSAGQPER